MPALIAYFVSSGTENKFNLFIIFLRWASTVFELINKASAMALVVLPSAINCSTSISRPVNSPYFFVFPVQRVVFINSFTTIPEISELKYILFSITVLIAFTNSSTAQSFSK
jgi:hypothetical protein